MEIVVKVKRDLQWRVIGMFGPSQREFTVIGFLYHKGKQYLPKGIVSELERRRDEIRASKFRKIRSCEPPAITERA